MQKRQKSCLLAGLTINCLGTGISCAVSRLVCESENYDLEMHVDVNTQLYPVDVGNKYTIVLASSISEDDSADKGYARDFVGVLWLGSKQSVLFRWKSQLPFPHCRSHRGYDPRPRSTLADRYDYVMNGKVYKIDDERDKLNVYASYGGLLMLLRGDKTNLEVCRGGKACLCACTCPATSAVVITCVVPLAVPSCPNAPPSLFRGAGN